MKASNEGVHRQAFHHAAWKGHGCDHILVNNGVPSLAQGSDNIASGLPSAMVPGTPSPHQESRMLPHQESRLRLHRKFSRSL